MNSEIKDEHWLKGMFGTVVGTDVEYKDMRGPLGSIKIIGPLLIISLPWWATYRGEKWVKCGDRLCFQFLKPKIELIDGKAIRLSTPSEFCVIFFAYDRIEPVVPAKN